MYKFKMIVMKYLVNLKLASALVGGVLISMLCGCDDADYKVIDNAVYLSEAYSNPGLSKKYLLIRSQV